MNVTHRMLNRQCRIGWTLRTTARTRNFSRRFHVCGGSSRSRSSSYDDDSSSDRRRQLSNNNGITVTTTSLPWIERTTWKATSTVKSHLDHHHSPPRRYFSKGWTGARGFDLTNDVYDNHDKDFGIPKINVSGYDEHGFVVKNMIQKVVVPSTTSSPHTTTTTSRKTSWIDVQNHSEADSDGSVYMHGSIIVYPTGCFLWNIPPTRRQPLETPSPSGRFASNSSSNSGSNSTPSNIISIESLAAIVLLRPHIEYLFIGCNDGYGSIANLNDIQYYFRHLAVSSSSSSNYSSSSMHRSGIVVEQMQLYNAIGTFNLLNAEDRQVAAALIVDAHE